MPEFLVNNELFIRITDIKPIVKTKVGFHHISTGVDVNNPQDVYVFFRDKYIMISSPPDKDGETIYLLRKADILGWYEA